MNGAPQNEDENSIPAEASCEANDGSGTLDRIEELATAGHTNLVPLLRYITELRDCMQHVEGGDIVAPIAFNAIDRILEAFADMPATTPVPSDEFSRRARALCADLIATSYDGDAHEFVNQVVFLRAEARSMLTGESVEVLRLDPRFRED
jgi:hypothetical protein